MGGERLRRWQPRHSGCARPADVLLPPAGLLLLVVGYPDLVNSASDPLELVLTVLIVVVSPVALSTIMIVVGTRMLVGKKTRRPTRARAHPPDAR